MKQMKTLEEIKYPITVDRGHSYIEVSQWCIFCGCARGFHDDKDCIKRSFYEISPEGEGSARIEALLSTKEYRILHIYTTYKFEYEHGDTTVYYVLTKK